MTNTDTTEPADRAATIHKPQGYRAAWAVAATVYEVMDPIRTRVVRYWDGADTWTALDGMSRLHATRDLAQEIVDWAGLQESALGCITHAGEPGQAGARIAIEDLRPRKVFTPPTGLGVLPASHGQDWEDLGARLSYVRYRTRFTQAKAAKAVGLPRVGLAYIESGMRKTYAIELKKLAALYGGTELAALLSGLGERGV